MFGISDEEKVDRLYNVLKEIFSEHEDKASIMETKWKIEGFVSEISKQRARELKFNKKMHLAVKR